MVLPDQIVECFGSHPCSERFVIRHGDGLSVGRDVDVYLRCPAAAGMRSIAISGSVVEKASMARRIRALM